MQKCNIRVLIVDDDSTICNTLEKNCKNQGWQPCVASQPANEKIVLAEARAFRPHVAIVDMRLIDSDESNQQGFTYIPKLAPAKCVVYSDYLTITATRDALIKAGAADVIEKTAPRRICFRQWKKPPETPAAAF